MANATQRGVNEEVSPDLPEEVESPSLPVPRQRRNSQQIWKEIQLEHKAPEPITCPQSRVPSLYGLAKHHPGCAYCADRDRAHIREFRRLAQDYPNIYSWICIYPEEVTVRFAKEILTLSIAIGIQAIIPFLIARQLYDNLDGELCKHTKPEDVKFPNLGKTMAFFLSLYFGLVSVNSSLGKVRGNAFLFFFSSLPMNRKYVLLIGLLAQTAGLYAANLAEYLLFVSRGTEDFLTMLFTATTMQGTLNADSTGLLSVSKGGLSTSIISKILSDEALDLGEQGDANLPKDLIMKLDIFRKLYGLFAIILFIFVVLLTASVTYCV